MIPDRAIIFIGPFLVTESLINKSIRGTDPTFYFFFLTLADFEDEREEDEDLRVVDEEERLELEREILFSEVFP